MSNIGQYFNTNLPFFVNDIYPELAGVLTKIIELQSTNMSLYTILDENKLYSNNEYWLDIFFKNNNIYDLYNKLPLDYKKALALSLNHFYALKGTREFIEIFFSFFNISCEVYNGYSRVIKLSDNDYITNLYFCYVNETQYLKLTDINQLSVIKFQNSVHPIYDIKKINGMIKIIFDDKPATFTSNEVKIILEDGTEFNANLVLFKSLNNFTVSAQTNSFTEAGTDIYEGTKKIGTVLTVKKAKLETVNLIYGGSGYFLNDPIYLNDTLIGYVDFVNSDGKVLSIKITNNIHVNSPLIPYIDSQSSNSTGAILQAIYLDNPGYPDKVYTYEFFETPTIFLDSLTLIPTTVYYDKYENRYLTNTNINAPSSNNAILQDSYMHQRFSIGLRLSNSVIDEKLLNHISVLGINTFIENKNIKRSHSLSATANIGIKTQVNEIKFSAAFRMNCDFIGLSNMAELYIKPKIYLENLVSNAKEYNNTINTFNRTIRFNPRGYVGITSNIAGVVGSPVINNAHAEIGLNTVINLFKISVNFTELTSNIGITGSLSIT